MGYESQRIHSMNSRRHELIVIQNGNNLPHIIQITDNETTESLIKQIQDTLDALKTATNKSKKRNWQIFEFHDHWIGNDCFEQMNINQNVLLIYYGDYLSNTFSTIFKYLSSQTNNFCFVLRPISLKQSLTEFNLQGYGVELAIKNMEYSVIDDRNVQSVQVDTDGNVQNVVNNEHQTNDIFHETFNFLTSVLENEDTPNLLEMKEDDMKQYMNFIDIQATKALLLSYDHYQDIIKSDKKEKNDKFLSIFREFSTNIPR